MVTIIFNDISNLLDTNLWRSLCLACFLPTTFYFPCSQMDATFVWYLQQQKCDSNTWGRTDFFFKVLTFVNQKHRHAFKSLHVITTSLEFNLEAISHLNEHSSIRIKRWLRGSYIGTFHILSEAKTIMYHEIITSFYSANVPQRITKDVSSSFACRYVRHHLRPFKRPCQSKSNLLSRSRWCVFFSPHHDIVIPRCF